jgi:hypothetical protein
MWRLPSKVLRAPLLSNHTRQQPESLPDHATPSHDDWATHERKPTMLRGAYLHERRTLALEGGVSLGASVLLVL